MQVKTLKYFSIKGKGPIPKGTVLKVRSLSRAPFELSPKTQIIEGEYSGEFIPREVFIRLPEEKTYTEKEWNDMENYYMELLDIKRERIDRFKRERNLLVETIEKYATQMIVADKVSDMLNDWLNNEYEGDEKDDRYNFALELTRFIQKKVG